MIALITYTLVILFASIYIFDYWFSRKAAHAFEAARFFLIQAATFLVMILYYWPSLPNNSALTFYLIFSLALVLAYMFKRGVIKWRL